MNSINCCHLIVNCLKFIIMINLETLPLKFSRKLQVERAKRRYSQEKLAELANLHRTTISAIEREKLSPSLDTIARLANAFEISFAEILDFENF